MSEMTRSSFHTKIVACSGEQDTSVAQSTLWKALLNRHLVVPWVLDAFERLLWWLFAGSAGALTRARVLGAIREEPRNAQQLSQALSLDYTTVRHHLRVLEQNRMVVTEGNSYGKFYFLSEPMEAHWQTLQAILDKTKKRGER